MRITHPDAPQQLNSAEAGQHDIKQQQIRLLLLIYFKSLVAAAGDGYAVPLAFQLNLQQAGDFFLILNNKNGFRHGHPSFPYTHSVYAYIRHPSAYIVGHSQA
ncbi:hypothetical protein D3C75_379650 [compost metagenome]